MSKITTSSSKITACPECDSGNLHVSGSEVECISCGWKHTAKKTRTTKQAKAELSALVGAEVVELAEKLTKDSSLAAQLAAAVTVAPKAKNERAPRQVPSTILVITDKGAAYNPVPKRSKVKGEVNAATWANIRAVFHDREQVPMADILAAIPTHKDFVGYALRSGWLAPAAQ